MIPRILFVTGAYYPEISSAARQCRDIARDLRGRACFSVLTTAVDRSLPLHETIDGVEVYRLPIDVASARSRLKAALRLAATFARVQASADVVHVHGFSTKNVPVTMLAKAFRKPLVLTLHTAGQDDAATVNRRGPLAAWAYQRADLITTVSPLMAAADSPAAAIEIPNGVDTARFAPATRGERDALRRRLGLPIDVTSVLFVGFFSRDKRPDLLCDAWIRLSRRTGARVSLVCVGAAKSAYFEVDPAIAAGMRQAACEAGLADRLILIEPTHAIEDYFRSADVFALPSAREALPMALLEAMACGLPPVAFRLAGATDAVVEDGVNGLLVNDPTAFETALESLVRDPARAQALGARARATIVARYAIEGVANRWLDVYRRLLSERRAS